jgi:hypothetical protein
MKLCRSRRQALAALFQYHFQKNEASKPKQGVCRGFEIRRICNVKYLNVPPKLRLQRDLHSIHITCRFVPGGAHDVAGVGLRGLAKVQVIGFNFKP